MATFHWKGINQQGLHVNGNLEAETLSNAIATLQQQQIVPIKVSVKKTLFNMPMSIKQTQLVDFTRQMATLLKTSIPIVTALQLLANSTEQNALRNLILHLKQRIEAGSNLSDALSLYPKYFDKIYCGLVAIGEQSGNLASLYQQLALHQEKMANLKRKLKKASIYPAIVVGISLLVMIGLITYVMPQFSKLFLDFGAELPAYSKLIFSLVNIGTHYGWLFIITLFIAIYLLIALKNHSSKFAFRFDAALLRLPLIGKTLEQSILASFSRTLATTLAAGMSLIEALPIITKSINNRCYQQAFTALQNDLLAGYSFHQAMRMTAQFPERLIQMMAIGEESSSLNTMLLHIANFYEELVDETIDQLTKLIEPVIMILLGLIIGSFIAAVYLPIFRLGSVV